MRLELMFRHWGSRDRFYGRQFFQERHRRHWLMLRPRCVDHLVAGLRRLGHFNHGSKSSFKIALGIALNNRLRFQMHHLFGCRLGYAFLSYDWLHRRPARIPEAAARSIHT